MHPITSHQIATLHMQDLRRDAADQRVRRPRRRRPLLRRDVRGAVHRTPRPA